MKPNPRERPDCWESQDGRTNNRNVRTHSLIIDDGDLFYASIPTEFVVQVPLGATNTEAENTKNAGGVWSLRER